MAKHGPCQTTGMNLNVWERKTAPVSYYINRCATHSQIR